MCIKQLGIAFYSKKKFTKQFLKISVSVNEPFLKCPILTIISYVCFFGGGSYKSPIICIFAHQGFCVYEALAHRTMIMCILTALCPVYNESFHCSND